MPCGCQGKKSGSSLPRVKQESAPAGRTTKRVAVYEVKVDGDVVLSTTSPVQARSEARRLGGSVRVTSRPAGETELSTTGS